MTTVNKKLLLYVLGVSISISTVNVLADNTPSCDIGAQENPSITATTAHLTDNHDGTISDSKTGLIWKKCVEGSAWNTVGSEQCLGVDQDTFTWEEALQHVQNVNTGAGGENFSQTDWRLPNIKELASIVELRCSLPAINITIFPDSLSSISNIFWSSSPYAPVSGGAWNVDFESGDDGMFSMRGTLHVRLVRSGQ